MMIEIAKALIKAHEGLRLKPYQCPAGKLTIGYGRNIEDNGITQKEAENLLSHDIKQSLEEAQTLSFFDELNDVRQAVIIDMIYNLGFIRFKGFERMLIALERGNYEVAAVEMLDSLWARQVGRRADTLSKLMREGEYHGTV